MAADVKQLDDTIEIVTPENIAFEYRLAGPFKRFLAYIVDLALRVAVFVGVSIVVSITLGAFLGTASFAVLFLLYFVIAWFYGGLFETYMNGQTPGKRLLGLRVLTFEGEPINGMQAVTRNIFRAVDEFPILSLQTIPWFVDVEGAAALYIFPTFIFGLVVMASNRRFQRLGDLVAGTMVLVEERHWLTGAVKLEDPRAAQLAEYIPANFVVTRTMARAIAAYADRRRFFSPARRKEVARHLAEPLLTLFQLPRDTSHDLLLCALYHRTFVLERPEDRKTPPRAMATPATAQPVYGTFGR